MDNNEIKKPQTYRDIVIPMLEKAEGFKDTVYYDTNNNPTIGHGINLNDKANQEMLRLNEINVDDLYKGRSLSPEQSSSLKHKILDRKEKELKSHVTDDLFNQLSANEQASLMSLMYNSRNLIGPKLREYLGSGDKLGAAREILANSNPKNELGTLFRRTDEAANFINNDDTQMADLFRTLSPEESLKIKNILDNTKNENVKRDYLEKYGKYVNPPVPSVPLTKLFNK